MFGVVLRSGHVYDTDRWGRLFDQDVRDRFDLAAVRSSWSKLSIEL